MKSATIGALSSKKVEAPLTAEQQARRDAEMAKKEADAKQAAEERRRTLALLSTYSSEKDIDSARDRNLAEIDKSIKEAEKRLDEASKQEDRSSTARRSSTRASRCRLGQVAAPRQRQGNQGTAGDG